MPDSRAIVFDLDDTLYPYRDFLRSGFWAVGRRLAEDRGLSVTAVVRVLRRALVNGDPGQELQALCTRFALPLAIVPSLVAVIREHTPTLGLPAESRRVLGSLRAGWKVGLLTNGTPAVQRRKVEALGLGDLVDAVLCAVDVGDGTGKPAASAFYAALERLGATPASAVFVGDDPEADLAGASAIGMKTIHVVAHRPGDGACSAAGCGIHVRSLALVPAMASQLVPVGIGECL